MLYTWFKGLLANVTDVCCYGSHNTAGMPVQVFDHFCPWVGNAIGKHNRHLFLMFIGCMLVALVGAYSVSLGRLSQAGFFAWGPRHRRSHLTPVMTWSLIWLICNIPLLFTVAGLAVAQGMQVCPSPTSFSPYKCIGVNEMLCLCPLVLRCGCLG